MSGKPYPQKKIQNPIFRFFILSQATGLGTGFAPFAPGTFGSILGIPLGLYLIQFPQWFSYLVCTVLFLFWSWVSHRACEHFGEMDTSRITLDEVLGMALTLLGLRNAVRLELIQGWQLWGFVLFGFVVFRILDITKPYPARGLDRRADGFGVMADDVVCGLYGSLFLWGFARILLS